MEVAAVAPLSSSAAEQNRRLTDLIRKLRPRLARFIRRRVAEEDVEDIVQEVFSELTEAYRVMTPIEEVGAWLFQVARNRIIDGFRKRRPEQFPEAAASAAEERELLRWEDTLPSLADGPDGAYARRVLLEELDVAIGELPEEQRAVFVAHELRGRSFKEIAADTGVGINTLLSRKHYAVMFLRRRLKAIYDEFVND
jgi:RNA polymerase sigma factor (sigma-70 family)